MSRMIPEARLAAAILRAAIDGDGADPRIVFPDHFDWDAFKEFAVTHEIVPFLYLFFKKNDAPIPQKVLAFFRETYYCTLVRCEHIREEFLRIARAFEEAGIGLVPLKGAAFLHDLYAAAPVRTMTDIDLLAAGKDLAEAGRIFSALGYQQDLEGLREEYWREKQYHIVFRRNGAGDHPLVELHWGLDYKRSGRQILPRMWERLRVVNADGRDVRLLSVEDTLFCLALHLRRYGKTQCLKNIFDAAVLLKKYRDTFDGDYLIKEARDGAMNATVYYLLRQVGFFLSADLPRDVENRLRVPWYQRKLIDRLIAQPLFPDFSYDRERRLFLKSHFLLYDSPAEPVRYILRIPPEQFCKYYGLTPYAEGTGRLYRLRIPYFLYRSVLDFLKKNTGRAFLKF